MTGAAGAAAAILAGDQRHLVTAVSKLAHLVASDERRTRHRHFVTHNAVEFGCVSDSFMDRQRQVFRIGGDIEFALGSESGG